MNDTGYDNDKTAESKCGLCCTKIEGLSVTIGKDKILEDIYLHIHCGELTALIGPNGAGKSTLLKAMLGDIPHTGELRFVDAKGKHSGSPLIGYVPQHLKFDPGTPASVLDLFASCKTSFPSWLHVNKNIRKDVRNTLDRVAAGHLIDRRIGVLSGGELQRVLLALALDPIPDILLLDEPLAGIDQNGLTIFYDIVSGIRKEYDLTIILVSHDLDLIAGYADRVVLLNKKVLCEGRPEEVFSDMQTKDIFGISRNMLFPDKNIKNPGG